jgi:hypothetical protein
MVFDELFCSVIVLLDMLSDWYYCSESQCRIKNLCQIEVNGARGEEKG